jgi:tRNA pseudouridine13 synthase
MAPHIESMRALIAADLQVELDQVNVKATTTEKLGFVGREEASPCIPLPCCCAHERTAIAGPAGLWRSPRHAVLKAIAEDFQVDEVLDIPLSGDGEHLWIWVEKRGLNTEEAARRIAKAAGVPLRTVSYAGLKDRQALTRQWFSVQLPGKADPDLSAAENDTLKILKTTRHKRKLQRGAHSANGFTLRLTQFAGDKDAIEQRLQLIASKAFPTISAPSVSAMTAATSSMPARGRRARRCRSSAMCVRACCRQRAAFCSIRCWRRVSPMAPGSGAGRRSAGIHRQPQFFPAGEAECSDPRLAILDLHPTGPQWGEGDSPATALSMIWSRRLPHVKPTCAIG